jgi:hypothetical protein
VSTDDERSDKRKATRVGLKPLGSFEKVNYGLYLEGLGENMATLKI